MKVEAREQALLQLVELYRDRECARILADAYERRANLRGQAYEKQRSALHQRVITERGRARALIEAARAERVTRERRLGEKYDEALLASIWPALHAALKQRWVQPATRETWLNSAFERALQILPRGDWVVRHAPDWPRAERDRLLTALAEQVGVAPSSSADTGISAGVVITCVGALFDASLDGMLRDRHRIEARALALWRSGYLVSGDLR